MATPSPRVELAPSSFLPFCTPVQTPVRQLQCLAAFLLDLCFPKEGLYFIYLILQFPLDCV